MLQTVDSAIANFPRLIESKAIAKNFTFDNLKQTIAKIEALGIEELGQGSLNLRWKEKNEAIEKVMMEYIASSIADKYPLTDFQSLKGLTRWVKLQFDADNNPTVVDESRAEPEDSKKLKENKLNIRWLELPLFSSFNAFSEKSNPTVNLGGIQSPKKGRMVRVNSTFPSRVAPSALDKYHDAVAIYYDCIAQLHRYRPTAQLLAVAHNRHSYASCCSNLGKQAIVSWIPKLEHLWLQEELIPPPGDPALFFKLSDLHFLIDIWAIEEEDPLKNIVKEFTSM